MTRPSAPCLALLLITASCASARPLAELAYVAPLGVVEVDYDCKVGPGPGLVTESRLREIDVPTSKLALRVRGVLLRKPAARRLLGWEDGRVAALRLPSRVLDAQLARLTHATGTVALDETLHCEAGERASLAAVQQTSYVRNFRVEVAPLALIADPVVATIDDGFALEVQAQGERGPYGIELRHVILDKPIPLAHVRVPLGSSPVTIQVPVMTTQELRAEAAIDYGETLALVGVSSREPDFAFVLMLSPIAEARPAP